MYTVLNNWTSSRPRDTILSISKTLIPILRVQSMEVVIQGQIYIWPFLWVPDMNLMHAGLIKMLTK